MKQIGYLAIFLMVLTSTHVNAASLQVRACKFVAKAGCVVGYTRVTLADGLVTRVELNADWCSPTGGLSYSCTIDASRSDKDSVWADEQGATVVTNPSPFNPTAPDRFKVTVGKYVSIDLAEAQSLGPCGAGAELPQAIVIPATNAPCRVWIDDP